MLRLFENGQRDGIIGKGATYLNDRKVYYTLIMGEDSIISNGGMDISNWWRDRRQLHNV